MNKIPFQTLIFYLILGLIFFSASHQDKIQEGIQTRTLNLLIPKSYQPLIELNDTGTLSNSHQLTKLTRYYEKIIEYYPQMNDARALLAFCYYYAGRYEDILELFEGQDIKYFWTRYLLALAQYQTQQFTDATQTLSDALQMNPAQSLIFIKSSPMILQPVLKESGEAQAVQTHLMEGHHAAARLLVQALSADGSHAEALRLTLSLITQSPHDDHALLYKYAGISARALNQTQKAVDFFRQSLTIKNDQPDIYEYLAQMADQSGQTQQASQLRNLAGSAASDSREVFKPRIF